MIKPSPPQWALDAGLPAPKARESFSAYCKRLGWTQADIEALLEGLTDQTAPLANSRMAALLTKRMPAAWKAYKEARRRGSGASW